MASGSPIVHDEVQQGDEPAKESPRGRIVAEARRHFFAYGFRGVTMDELAGTLGMSKKTLYAQFPSKAALVEAVVLDKFRDVEADLERITSKCSSDFLSTLHQLLACMHRHLEEIQPPFVRDVRREAPEMFKRLESRRRDMINRYFGKLLGEGQRAGIIRKDIPIRLVIEILLSTVQAIMNPEKITELGLTPKAGFSAITTVILEGVITELGRAEL